MTCTCCKVEGPQENFFKFKRGNKIYRRHKCKACYKKEAKANFKSFHRKNVKYSHGTTLKRKYGMTVADYEKMFEDQNGLCKICNSPAPQTKKSNHFHVDHCHTTGKIRGLLCHRCNSVLGFARDSIPVLEEAINYLKTTK